MKDQTWKHCLFWFILLELVCNTIPSLAQRTGEPLRLTRGGATASPGSHVPRASTQSLAPGSPSYTFSYFDYPQSPYTVPYGINSGAMSSKMAIVGPYGPEMGDGFVLEVEGKKGTSYVFRTVAYPGEAYQEAFGVNDLGWIVGYYYDGSVDHGYEFSGGKFKTLDVPFSGAVDTYASGINNSGDVVGIWVDSGGVNHGFLLKAGVYVSFDYPGSINTEADSLNNVGDIVGSYEDPQGNWHGYTDSGGNFSSIDVPGAQFTDAIGINDSGDVVGDYCMGAGCVQSGNAFQGFLLRGGVYTTINVPGAINTILENINNNDVIVGGYLDSRGEYDSLGAAHGFIAYP